MHSLATAIGFGGSKIDRLVANRAIDLQWNGTCHKATSRLFLAEGAGTGTFNAESLTLLVKVRLSGPVPSGQVPEHTARISLGRGVQRATCGHALTPRLGARRQPRNRPRPASCIGNSRIPIAHSIPASRASSPEVRRRSTGSGVGREASNPRRRAIQPRKHLRAAAFHPCANVSQRQHCQKNNQQSDGSAADGHRMLWQN